MAVSMRNLSGSSTTRGRRRGRPRLRRAGGAPPAGRAAPAGLTVADRPRCPLRRHDAHLHPGLRPVAAGVRHPGLRPGCCATSPPSGAGAASSARLLLRQIRAAFERQPHLPHLLIDAELSRLVTGRRPALVAAAGAGMAAGIPVPGLIDRSLLPGRLPRGLAADQPHPGSARLLRRAHLSAGRPGGRLPHRLVGGSAVDGDGRPAGVSVSVLPDAESLACRRRYRHRGRPGRAVPKRGRFTIALAGGCHSEAGLPAAGRAAVRRVDALGADRGLLGRRALCRRRTIRAATSAWPARLCSTTCRSRPSRCIRCGAGAGARAPPGRARRICGPRAGGRLRAAAAGPRSARRRDYEAVLRSALGEAGGIDLVLLGLGRRCPHRLALPRLRERWMSEESGGRRRLLEDPATPPPADDGRRRSALWRVTLTAPFINRAGMVLFVVSGAPKAAAVKARPPRRGRSARSTGASHPAHYRPAVVAARRGGGFATERRAGTRGRS